jgi:hypothetical protein
LAAYNSIGTGVNLQYPIPKGFETVQVGEVVANRDKKDFDAIYLDKPTNLAPNTNGTAGDHKVLLDYSLKVCELAENMEIKGGDANKNKCLKALCEKYGEGNDRPNCILPVSLKGTRSAKINEAKFLCQAIGRICRTVNKNKEIAIFVDRSIVDEVEFSEVAIGLENVEFAKFKEAVLKEQSDTVVREVDFKEALIAKNKRVWRGAIRPCLEGSWNKKKRDSWIGQREQVLRAPTFDDPNDYLAGRFMYTQAPYKLNEYSYLEECDFTKITDAEFGKIVPGWKHFSAQDCGLTDLMCIPEVKEHFELMGYATEFKQATYVMTPVQHHNIYKGALGEVAGKFIFEELTPYELLPIVDLEKFEVFDFQVAGKNVYIDFKNWKSSFKKSECAEVDKVGDKLLKIGGDRVAVVNVLGSSTSKVTAAMFKSAEKLDCSKVLTIPYLYDVDKREYSVDNINELIKFIREGKDEVL